MNTPFFPSLRPRLAALGRRTVHSLRQATLGQLQEQIRGLLPAPLLSSEEEGPNSREREFPLRLTLECFLWQRLKPKTPCREVVLQVQALRTLHGLSLISKGDSAYVQSRLRLPKERLEKALSATSRTADRRVGQTPQLQGRPIMEQLRCKTPEMAEKELLAYLVAHNLVRCLMAEAVAAHAVELERVSFKGSVDALRQFSEAISRAPNRKLRRQLWRDLLLAIARDLVPLRPNRLEPRAVKRRPKSYPLLNKPRRKFVEISHRGRYWKGRPRNYRGLN
jgi:hypothetical protein